MRSLVILGSTGSIGTQALEVAQQAGYAVVGLAAARQVDLRWLLCMTNRRLPTCACG